MHPFPDFENLIFLVNTVWNVVTRVGRFCFSRCFVPAPGPGLGQTGPGTNRPCDKQALGRHLLDEVYLLSGLLAPGLRLCHQPPSTGPGLPPAQCNGACCPAFQAHWFHIFPLLAACPHIRFLKVHCFQKMLKWNVRNRLSQTNGVWALSWPAWGVTGLLATWVFVLQAGHGCRAQCHPDPQVA